MLNFIGLGVFFSYSSLCLHLLWRLFPSIPVEGVHESGLCNTSFYLAQNCCFNKAVLQMRWWIVILRSENKCLRKNQGHFCPCISPHIVLQKYVLLGRLEYISVASSQTSASSVAVLQLQGVLLVSPGNLNTQIPACSWTSVLVSD